MLEVPGLLVVALVALTNAVDIVICLVALAFLVHHEDALLPFIVVLGNSYPDTGDDRCE